MNRTDSSTHAPIVFPAEQRARNESARDQIVARYRTIRTTPRPGFRPDEGKAYEDPAPPWVPAIVDTAFRRGVNKFLLSSVMRWCEDGDPVQRAELVCNLINLWPGASENVECMLRLFLEDAVGCGAGRRAGTRRRRVRAISIHDSWDEVDAKRRAALEIAALVPTEVARRG